MTIPGDEYDSGAGSPPVELTKSVVQILDRYDRPAGTGFLVGDHLLVTCAHVLADVGRDDVGRDDVGGDTEAIPAVPVRVRFVHLDQLPRQARVLPERWRGPREGDIAFLHLADPLPPSARPLPLGAAAGIGRRHVKTFGFPVNAPGSGHYGYGVTGDPIRGDDGTTLLQLTDCTEVTEGFSGGPVLDERTGLVIGMVDSVAGPDRHGRGRSTAYVTPTETLRAVHPGLALPQTCPYPGLRAFTAADAAWFYGRDRAIRSVLTQLDREPGFLALLGPSGSGKSSLLAAGVRPALRRADLPGSDRWGWLTARPGSEPYAHLAQAGLPAAEAGLAAAVRRWLDEHPELERLVLVLDQFEELLVATPPQPRERLLHELVEVCERNPAATVVVSLRDDFYSRLAAAAPTLMPLLERGLVNVPAVLEPTDLAEIVQRPAHAVGLALEPNLTERVIRDAAQVSAPTGAAGTAPTTVLPLLSSALAELWHRRADGRLTHRAYEQIGGVIGWLDRWGDQAYAEACRAVPADRQPLVRQVITALVRPGDDAVNVPPTRQRRTLDQLRTIAPSGTGVGRDDPRAAVVAALADRRLVTTGREPGTGEPVVELAHEALIHEWRTLRRWLVEDHDFLAWRRDLESTYAQWRASAAGRGSPDPELLLHGSALDGAREWLARRPDELTSDLVDFVRLSTVAEQRRLNRDRRRVVALAALLALSVLLGSFAWLQAGRAADQAARAREQTLVADSRRMAAQAASVLDQQPDLALLLGLESLRTAPSREAWASLASVMSRPVATSRVLYGHESSVKSVAFSPDGTTLATADFRGRARLWDAGSGQPLGALDGPRTDQDVAFSPDGRWLATTGLADGIWLWDAATHRTVGDRLGQSGLLGAVAFSPDGTLLAGIVNAGDVQFWDVTSRRPVGPVIDARAGNLAEVVFSPDGKTLAAASDSGIIRLFDVATRRTVDDFRIPQSAIAVAFSPDGKLLAVGGQQGVVYLVGAEHRLSGEPLRVTGSIRDLAFRPGGKTIVTAGSEGVVQEWNLDTRQPAGPPLLGHRGSVDTVTFSPDGTTLATGGADQTVRLWDLTVTQPLGAAVTTQAHPVNSVAFSPDGTTLATGGFDQTVRRWNAATGEPVGEPLISPGHEILAPNKQISDDPVLTVGFSSDGRQVITRSTSGVRLWDQQTSTPRAVFDIPAEAAVAVSPDGALLATTSKDKTVRLWDVATHRSVRELKQDANAVAFSPDGRLLATGDGGLPGTVRVWDVTTGERVAEGELHKFEIPGVIAFSPDRKTLVTANGPSARGVHLWRLDGDELHDTPLATDDIVNAAAFSPDGKLLATAGDDHTVRLWEVATGAPFADPLVGHTNRVLDVAFSPDGDVLASAAGDGTVRLWATPQTWVRHACALAGRNLTRTEWDRYLPGKPYVRTCPAYPSGHAADPDAAAATYPTSP